MGNGLTNFLQKYSKVTKEDALANNIIKFESTNLLYNKIFFYTKVNLIVWKCCQIWLLLISYLKLLHTINNFLYFIINNFFYDIKNV